MSVGIMSLLRRCRRQYQYYYRQLINAEVKPMPLMVLTTVELLNVPVLVSTLLEAFNVRFKVRVSNVNVNIKFE